MTAHSNRHDWVLLLPSTVHVPVDDVIVIGGTADVAQSLVDHKVALGWRRPASPSDRAAVTVAWADATESPAELARHVACGGVLIAEIERRRSGRRLLTGRRIARQLRRAELEVHSVHAVEPSFANPGRYLPVDAPRALRWYLRTLFVAGTPRLAATRAMLSIVTATPLGERCAGAAAMRMLVIATAAPIAAGDSQPDGQMGDRTVVLTSGYDAGSRAIALPFAARAHHPREVIKVANQPQAAEATLTEHARLTELHRELPASVSAALPVPVSSTVISGRVACIQTCAPGPSVRSLVGRWRSGRRRNRTRFERVDEWLVELAMATRVTAGDHRSAWMDVFDDLRDGVRAAHADLPGVVDDVLRAAEVAAYGSGLARQAVHQHYDTGPWNVHLDYGDPFVVDWEADSLRPADCLGPPLADSLYLATYWYFLVRGCRTPGDEERAVVRLFADPVASDRDVLAVRRALDRSLVRLGLPRRAVPAALIAMWAERALYTQRRRAAHDGKGHDDIVADIRPHAYLRALATAPGLFGTGGWWSYPTGTNVAAASADIGTMETAGTQAQ